MTHVAVESNFTTTIVIGNGDVVLRFPVYTGLNKSTFTIA